MRIWNNNNNYIFNKGGDRMIGFLIGVILGGSVGIIVMALMSAAAQADREMKNCRRGVNEPGR